MTKVFVMDTRYSMFSYDGTRRWAVVVETGKKVYVQTRFNSREKARRYARRLGNQYSFPAKRGLAETEVRAAA